MSDARIGLPHRLFDLGWEIDLGWAMAAMNFTSMPGADRDRFPLPAGLAAQDDRR
jgi:hypothetical protein